jgi:hypothetical protein
MQRKNQWCQFVAACNSLLATSTMQAGCHTQLQHQVMSTGSSTAEGCASSKQHANGAARRAAHHFCATPAIYQQNQPHQFSHQWSTFHSSLQLHLLGGTPPPRHATVPSAQQISPPRPLPAHPPTCTLLHSSCTCGIINSSRRRFMSWPPLLKATVLVSTARSKQYCAI